MSGWNYRIMRHETPHPLHKHHPDKYPETEEWFAIHEVFYDEDGKVNGWTKEPIELLDENVAGLRAAMDMISSAFQKPILEYNVKDES